MVHLHSEADVEVRSHRYLQRDILQLPRVYRVEGNFGYSSYSRPRYKPVKVTFATLLNRQSSRCTVLHNVKKMDTYVFKLPGFISP